MDILFTIAKYLLWFILAFIIYILYDFIYKPWKLRQTYLKYKNVDLADKFYPFVGDVAIMNKYKRQNEYQMYDFINTVLTKQKDIKLIFYGPKHVFEMVSIKAAQELEALCPKSIDRHPSEFFPIWYIVTGSFLLTPSSENWKERRQTFVKTVGINNISSYIPMMIRACDEVLDSYKSQISDENKKHEINFTTLVKKMSFRIICMILFGRDMPYTTKKVEYIDPITGAVSQKTFEDAYYQIFMDIVYQFSCIKGNLLPFCEKYNLIYPFKAVNRNKETLHKVVREFCDSSKDENSVFNQIVATGKFKRSEVYEDNIAVLAAGMDTTSTVIASGLYLLKKNPDVHDKLFQEMKESGLDILSMDLKKPEEKQESGKMTNEEVLKIKDNFQHCDYLNYVVKETMRVDNSAISSIRYITRKDVVICGVPIPKGNVVSYAVNCPHYDPKQWHSPTEFIPERFDPESNYFYIPGSDSKRRSPNAWMPFSIGMRSCPGQILAQIEIRVLLARIIHRMEYSIKQEFLDSDKALFNIISQFDVLGTINSIK